MGEIIKECGCGRKYDRTGWDSLAKLPNWVMEWGEVQEVRNCTCGSTIVIVIVEGEPEFPEPQTRFERV